MVVETPENEIMPLGGTPADSRDFRRRSVGLLFSRTLGWWEGSGVVVAGVGAPLGKKKSPENEPLLNQGSTDQGRELSSLTRDSRHDPQRNREEGNRYAVEKSLRKTQENKIGGSPGGRTLLVKILCSMQ